jgi:hypothetical protein
LTSENHILFEFFSFICDTFRKEGAVFGGIGSFSENIESIVDYDFSEMPTNNGTLRVSRS